VIAHIVGDLVDEDFETLFALVRHADMLPPQLLDKDFPLGETA
jgi:hypothetical protein